MKFESQNYIAFNLDKGIFGSTQYLGSNQPLTSPSTPLLLSYRTLPTQRPIFLLTTLHNQSHIASSDPRHPLYPVSPSASASCPQVIPSPTSRVPVDEVRDARVRSEGAVVPACIDALRESRLPPARPLPVLALAHVDAEGAALVAVAC
jgi:hypothetical protein